MTRTAALCAAAAALLGACVRLDFSRKISDEEYVLRTELRSYYDQVAAAFAGGNAEALAGLFDSAISRPMTREQVAAWGREFFGAHGPARFKVEALDYERVGHVSASVVLSYRVETRDGAGSFRGVERDELVKRRGRWYTASWERLPDRQK